LKVKKVNAETLTGLKEELTPERKAYRVRAGVKKSSPLQNCDSETRAVFVGTLFVLAFNLST
jgi:hypothetical protein